MLLETACAEPVVPKHAMGEPVVGVLLHRHRVSCFCSTTTTTINTDVDVVGAFDAHKHAFTKHELIVFFYFLDRQHRSLKNVSIEPTVLLKL
jgi:hypothetical protein